MATNGIDGDDKPYTPEELMNIITAPSGGMTMLPDQPYDEVYGGVYVGEESIAKSPVTLKKIGITHIINAAEGEADGFHVRTNQRMYKPVDITYFGIQANDHMNFDLSQYFQQCSDYIDEALSKGGKVMINCKVGASRSATIAIAFLMLKRHLPVQDAVRMCRSKREICPNDGFLQQLCDFNEKLKKEGHFDKKYKEEQTTVL